MAVQSTTKDPVMVAAGDAVADTAASHGKCIFLDHNSSLKKTKRKRTSAQDQVTLENAYLKNSKPDKGERAAIVSLVDLSEKEVQIWFQNRRQNDRRRSKPLQDHEIEAHIAKSTASPNSTTIDDSQGPTGSPISDNDDESTIPSSTNETSPLASSAETIATSSLDVKPTIETECVLESEVKSTGSPDSASGRKRDHAEMVTGKNTSTVAETVSDPLVDPEIKAKIKEPLKRASSMRLAMTADGAVKIRTSDSPTPSPPKQRTLASVDNIKRSKLTRSVSMFEDGQTFREPASSKKLAAITPNFGRSRDARTWEFYCDSGSKDDLSTQAEAQSKGSAVGAINLIRTNNIKSRTALSPIPAKGNSKPVKSAKAKIVRAQSSLARLQAAPLAVAGAKAGNIPSGRSRRPRRPSNGDHESDNDSDKENWLPGTRRSHHALRNPGGRTLDQFDPLVRITPGDRDLSEIRRRVVPADRTENNINSHAHPDQSTRAQASELDVVQSLLSLSQGAWR